LACPIACTRSNLPQATNESSTSTSLCILSRASSHHKPHFRHFTTTLENGIQDTISRNYQHLHLPHIYHPHHSLSHHDLLDRPCHQELGFLILDWVLVPRAMERPGDKAPCEPHIRVAQREHDLRIMWYNHCGRSCCDRRLLCHKSQFPHKYLSPHNYTNFSNSRTPNLPS
jgi:hypothetical protein